MTIKKVDTLVGIFYGLSAVIVLIGAFFKLQHYPNGFTILIIGFILGSITSSVDTFRQKKKIKILEEQLKQKE